MYAITKIAKIENDLIFVNLGDHVRMMFRKKDGCGISSYDGGSNGNSILHVNERVIKRHHFFQERKRFYDNIQILLSIRSKIDKEGCKDVSFVADVIASIVKRYE